MQKTGYQTLFSVSSTPPFDNVSTAATPTNTDTGYGSARYY